MEGVLLGAIVVAVLVGLWALVEAARPRRESQGGSWATHQAAGQPTLRPSSRVSLVGRSGPRRRLKELEPRGPQESGSARGKGL